MTAVPMLPSGLRHPSVRRSTIGGITLVALTFIALTAGAVHEGLPAQNAVRLIGCLLIFQLAPGILIWRAVRPLRGWWLEDVAFGFPCGFVISVSAQVVAGSSSSRLLSALIPLAVALALMLIPATRRRIRRARTDAVPWWVAAVIAAASAFAVPGLISYFHINPVRFPTGSWIPQVDQNFQLALTQTLLHRGPAQWPFVIHQELDYHWFTHAWMAHLSAISGVPPDHVLMRFAPVVAPLMILLPVAALVLRLGGSGLAAAAGAVLVMAGGYGSAWAAASPGLPLTPNSPTTAAAVPPMLALVAVLAIRWRHGWSWPTTVMVVVLAVAAAGTKGSTTPLILAGTVLALCAMAALQRRTVRIIAVDLLLITAALLITATVVFGGSTTALTFDPQEALQGTFPVSAAPKPTTLLIFVLGAATLIMSSITRGALGFWLLLRPGQTAGRRDPVLWLLLGGTVAGACVPCLFVQPGGSQYYFRISAMPLAAVASAIALDPIRERYGKKAFAAAAIAVVAGPLVYHLPRTLIRVDRHHSGAMLLVLSLGAALILVAALIGGLRFGKTFAALVAAATVLTTGMASVQAAGFNTVQTRHSTTTAYNAESAAQIEVARYIDQHAGPRDVVMSNRHCTRGGALGGRPCDTRRFLVGAYGGRQMLIEGWGYSPKISAMYPHGRESMTAPFWDPELLRQNDSFYTKPTAQAATRLWALGVRWIYVDNLRAHAPTFAPFADNRMSNPSASVWHLRSPEYYRP